MKVNASNKNKALIELIVNPNATIFLDANFFIPPDRSKYIKMCVRYPLINTVLSGLILYFKSLVDYRFTNLYMMN